MPTPQPEPGHGGVRFSIIISVDTPEEVDELAARVRQAGGKLTKDPVDAEFFVGRDAYFETRKATIGRSPVPSRTTRSSLLRVGRRAWPVGAKRLKPARKAGEGKRKRRYG